MVACTYHPAVANCRAIRFICRFCNGSIHIHVILMINIISHIRSVGMGINKIVIKILLTLVYVLVILPYHIIMQDSKRNRWISFNKTYTQKDFIHMG